jgi:hypothetical protein
MITPEICNIFEVSTTVRCALKEWHNRVKKKKGSHFIDYKISEKTAGNRSF